MRQTGIMALLAGALCAWAPAPSHAQTIEDSFRSAVAFSPELGAQRARVRAQRQGTSLALAEALPQIDLTGTASRVFRDDPTFRQRGSEKREDWRGTASASQLLFDSGRVWSLYRQARAQAVSAELIYGEAAQALLFETAQAYAEVRRAEGVVKANEKTLENLHGQRRYIEANLRGGFLTNTDLAQADARIAAARSGVARSKADLVVAERAFQRLVGRAPGTLEPLSRLEGLPLSEEEALSLGKERRRVLQAARLAVTAADAALDVSVATGRPRLTFEASSTIENGFEDPRDARAIDDLVGLRVVVPFSSGGANRARIRQQKAFREVARQEAMSASLDLEQSIVVAWAGLIAARAAEEASMEEVRAAELALRGVRREQENGLRAIVDVLDQEQALLQAELALRRAERDVSVAEYRLLFEIGGLNCEACAP
jgi:outer membrane protein